jgi:Leucine-rich repeat (LRR) protein
MGTCSSSSAGYTPVGGKRLTQAQLQGRLKQARVTKSLSLANCRLNELPPEAMELLGTLRMIDVSGNPLRDLEWVRSLAEVRKLKATHCGLEALPSLAYCTHLEELRVAHNALSAARISDLPPSLRQLDLSRNELASIPESVLACSSLEVRLTGLVAL